MHWEGKLEMVLWSLLTRCCEWGGCMHMYRQPLCGDLGLHETSRRCEQFYDMYVWLNRYYLDCVSEFRGRSKSRCSQIAVTYSVDVFGVKKATILNKRVCLYFTIGCNAVCQHNKIREWNQDIVAAGNHSSRELGGLRSSVRWQSYNTRQCCSLLIVATKHQLANGYIILWLVTHTHTCKQIPLGLRKRLSILRTVHEC